MGQPCKKRTLDQKVWPERKHLVVGHKNVIADNLVERDKVIFPSLHIKLGLMKQFVKALDSNGSCFSYLRSKFPKLTDAKVKDKVFVAPQIRKLFKDVEFDNAMNSIKRKAWTSFKNVVKNFLGNKRSESYQTDVADLLTHCHSLGCNKSPKIHYLNSHLDRFPENCGDVSEEQGERMHQDMQIMENRYEGRWNVKMMADYYWSLYRDLPQDYHNRKTKIRSFQHKRSNE